MKVIEKNNGWDEVVTTKVRFNGFSAKYFLQCRVWQDTMKNSDSGGRVRCDFCKKKWADQPNEYWTSLVQTTQGNKVLCVDCFEDFGLNNTGPSKEEALNN